MCLYKIGEFLCFLEALSLSLDFFLYVGYLFNLGVDITLRDFFSIRASCNIIGQKV